MRVTGILGRILLALLALVLLAAVAGFLILRSSLPQVEGQLAVAGLQGPVTVVRDADGVAHINADSISDAYRALGFVHAQDRLWQMEFQRLVAAGRLSEAVGEPGLDTDIFLRTIGVAQAAENAWANLDDAEMRRWLEAYTAGVNSYLESRSGVLPPEFLLLGHEPEPFTPVDIIGWGKMMAWDLAGNWDRELLRARLMTLLDEQEVRNLYPQWPGDMHVTIEGSWSDPEGPASPVSGDTEEPGEAEPEELPLPPGQAATPDILAQFDLAAVAAAFRPRLSYDAGSNAWVLAGEHTASGMPLLANDPHLGMSAPSLWYLVHIQAPGLDVMGGSLPGTPAVLLGRNADIAWGLTNTGTDVQDLFIEQLSPTDDGAYLTEDGYVDFTVRTEVIRVKGQEDVVLEVRESRHGPVVSDIAGDFGEIAELDGNRYVLTLRWSALDETDGTVGAVVRLNQATDWESFNAALEGFANPQQNIMYADMEGNVGFLAPGRVPVRPQGDGFAPVPGWTGEYSWTGYVPFAELPRSYNPPGGRIINANQQVTPADYPHLLTLDWTVPYRADRIIELLDSLERHNVRSSMRIQTDEVSLYARELAGELLQLDLRDARLQELQAELFGWTGEMASDAVAPLIIAAWQREFLPLALGSRLGGHFAAWAGHRPVVILELLRGPDSACEPVGCEELALRAFEQAADWLESQLGPDVSGWHWGRLHRLEQEHAVLGGSPLAALANLGIETGGGTYTVNAARYDLMGTDAPFRQTEGPGYRTVMDLGDPDSSVFMQSTGQSGNLLSPHYRDLQAPWRDGRGLNLGLQVPADGRVLELVPASR